MKRSALLIGLNKEQKILLHHKTPDAPTNANLWVLLGGAIEINEEAQNAIEREIKEELGLDIKPKFFKSYEHEEPWGTVERHIFYSTILKPLNELKSVLTEGDDLGFFSLEQMTRLPMNERHNKIIGDFINSGLKF